MLALDSFVSSFTFHYVGAAFHLLSEPKTHLKFILVAKCGILSRASHSCSAIVEPLTQSSFPRSSALIRVPSVFREAAVI